jgi:ligand-binding sensor domain-containing protein/signal transduction histidine kinase
MHDATSETNDGPVAGRHTVHSTAGINHRDRSMSISRKRPPVRGVACLLIIPLLCVTSLWAENQHNVRPLSQYVQDRWTEKDGLPQNGVYGLMQDRLGYLWFGTQEGLVRFDGLHFTVFDRANSPEMKSSWISHLLEDEEGGMWVSYSTRGSAVARYQNGVFRAFDRSDGLRSNNVAFSHLTRDSSVWFIHGPWGVTQYKNGVMTSYGHAEGLPSDTVFAVSDDSRGNIWFATPQGIVKYDRKTYTLYSNQNGLPQNRVWWINNLADCIFEDSRHNIWMATNAGLVRFADGNMKTFTKSDGLLENRVFVIIEDSTGTLWFVTRSGINSLTNGILTSYPSPDPFGTINDYAVDKDNDILLATEHGLYRFADSSYDHFGKENGLSDELCRSILTDEEGSIWIGTDSGGLYRLREGKFVTYGKDRGLKDEITTSVLEDSKGILWLGTMTGGLAKLSGGTTTVIDKEQGVRGRINIVREAPDGTLWFGADDGLHTLRNGRIARVPTAAGLDSADLRDLIFRKSGEMVVADLRSVFRLKDKHFEKFFPEEIQGGISLMVEDAQENLWIGTYGNGLYRYGKTGLTHFSEDQGFTGSRIYGLYPDRDGSVWIGTAENGLFRFRDNKFSQFTPQTGLFDYGVAGIIEDDVGWMWFSGNKGVYRIKKQALDDFASGKSTSYSYDAYGTADGMRSRETNALGHPNLWKMKDGRIVFTTVAGAAIVDPARIRINRVPPRVVIENFSADNTTQDLQSAITLPPGTGNLEFRYVGLTFIGSDRVQYRYKLDGYETNWVNPGNRNAAFFTHLGPGDYTFHVLAANADGVWDSTGASVSFTIQPHFYESRWFYAFTLLGFLFGGPSIYLLRVRQLKRREAELAGMVDVRTKELRGALDNLKETQNQLVLSEKMASLGQLTAGIAHEIKNPLNFITNFAVLSRDLTRDLRQELEAERDRVDKARAIEIEGILKDLEQNVDKINEHGKRADSIVRGMLLHSRGKAGERQETDMNALLAEYTNLAYHGMRAQDHSFNVKLETEFDPSVGKVSVVPQDLSRAFLNIVNNACYAANERRKTSANGFNPIVKVTTRNLQDSIEIRVKDNGTGIPQNILDKIFNPFFTTKPSGAGTGLGLSLSYDIITQEHKGEIRVDSKEGDYTEFIIKIPRHPGNGGGFSA